jgi:hypothetical protein
MPMVGGRVHFGIGSMSARPVQGAALIDPVECKTTVDRLRSTDSGLDDVAPVDRIRAADVTFRRVSKWRKSVNGLDSDDPI